MFDKQAALRMIQDSLDGLQRAGTITKNIDAKLELVLMGSGADENLDSLGFVTFIMDLEDRMETIMEDDAQIILTDIEGFDVNNPALTVDGFSDYLVSMTAS